MICDHRAILILAIFPNVGNSQHTVLNWLTEAALPGKIPAEELVGKLVQRNSSMHHPWEIDNINLEARLRYLKEARSPQIDDELVWPQGTVDYDRAIGVDHSYYALPASYRCSLLTRPQPEYQPTRSIAILLTGQLRTADVAIPVMEETVIKATSPNPVLVFAHVWAMNGWKSQLLDDIDPSLLTPSSQTGDDRYTPSYANRIGVRRLLNLPNLKSLVVEPQESFDKIVTNFYNKRYGEGWIERRLGKMKTESFWKTATGSFMSQWYKVSVGYGMLRRWYLNHGTSPLVVLRIRPDHLITTRWNLTLAHLEFQSRAAARAAGGNYVAVWGPSSHSSICSARFCGAQVNKHDKRKTDCYLNGRLNDAFAFGTPPALDGYTAPYHPYMSKFCEEYVTITLPLANLVQVGAEHSAGGYFGSLGMPGSCNHQMGHYPLRSLGKRKSATFKDQVEEVFNVGFTERGDNVDTSFLEYDLRDTSGIPANGVPMVPGPFRSHYNISGNGENLNPYVTSHEHFNVLPFGNAMYANANGLRFDHLCAPIFYFMKYGGNILRFNNAQSEAKRFAQDMSQTGVCYPLIEKDRSTLNLPPEQQTCSDFRRKFLKSHEWIERFIHKSNHVCGEECSDNSETDMQLLDFDLQNSVEYIQSNNQYIENSFYTVSYDCFKRFDTRRDSETKVMGFENDLNMKHEQDKQKWHDLFLDCGEEDRREDDSSVGNGIGMSVAFIRKY